MTAEDKRAQIDRRFDETFAVIQNAFSSRYTGSGHPNAKIQTARTSRPRGA